MKNNIKNKHVPVLFDEVKKFLPNDKRINVIDATFGGGGYSKLILKEFDVKKLIAIDRDPLSKIFAAEITREKIFHQLYDELPYATTVETENWETLEDSTIRIKQVVYVKRDSQKAIMLGKKGNRIKSIGIEARTELQNIFGCPVQLMLFVKVRKNWTDDPSRYKEWCLDFNA